MSTLQTTVRNVSSGALRFSFLPPHGIILQPNETYTWLGTLGDVGASAGHETGSRARAFRAFQYCLDNNLLELFDNVASMSGTEVTLGDFIVGGVVGSAATTVDVATGISIAQITPGQTLLLPPPSDTTITRVVAISNTGAAEFSMHGASIGAGESGVAVWNVADAEWRLVAAGEAAGGWILLAAPQALQPNRNYVLLAPGNYTLPAGVALGDVVTVVASPTAPGSIVLVNPTGDLYSAPGQVTSNLILPNHVKFDTFHIGGDDWSTLRQFAGRSVFGNNPVNGVLGTADNLLSDLWFVAQTTPGVALTLPAGLSAFSTFDLAVVNTGTAAFTLNGETIAPGNTLALRFDGTTWYSASTTAGQLELETLTVVGTNTVNDLSFVPASDVEFRINGVITTGITSVGTVVTVNPAVVGYNVETVDVVTAQYMR
jgi:hypothetical protein